ncbi:unnamed protein product [Ophioblennius macclurei]
MRFSTPLFLLVLSCVCMTMALVSVEDCCLKYMKRMNHKTQRHVVDYREQRPDGGCNIHAIIFTMKRGRKLCANPHERWVKNLIWKLEDDKESQLRNKFPLGSTNRK